MAVRFVEGWDFHTLHSGGNNGFQQDYNNYWFLSNAQVVSYVEGYNNGQAVFVTNDIGTNALKSSSQNSNSIPNTGVLRVYFWAKFNGELTGTAYRPFIAVTRGNFGDRSIAIEANGSGDIRISEVGFLGDTPSVLAGPVAGVIDDEWACYEFYVNENNDTTEFRKNGFLIAASTDPFTVEGSENRNLVFGRPNISQTPSVDHIIVTDGERLASGTSVLHGLAVGCAFDHWTGSSAQLFKGALSMGGTVYNTATQSQDLDDPDNDPDENYAPAAYFVYPTRPDTGNAWTNVSNLNSVNAWGLCSENTTADDALRLTSLGLMKIVNDPATGFPIIETVRPGTLITLTGTWIKTDENMTYGGHLNDIPHAELLSADEYLVNTAPGCLLVSIVTAPVLQTFGLTFAEEFRTDFVDWYTIDGAGTNFESYFISGHSVLGEGNKKFQSNYVTVNYQDTEVSAGAYFQGIWDYALDGDTGRWSVRQNIYTGNEGNYKHFFRRLKVRGHGKVLQFKVTSERGKDFIINGWVVQASANGSV